MLSLANLNYSIKQTTPNQPVGKMKVSFFGEKSLFIVLTLYPHNSLKEKPKESLTAVNQVVLHISLNSPSSVPYTSFFVIVLNLERRKSKDFSNLPSISRTNNPFLLL